MPPPLLASSSESSHAMQYGGVKTKTLVYLICPQPDVVPTLYFSDGK